MGRSGNLPGLQEEREICAKSLSAAERRIQRTAPRFANRVDTGGCEPIASDLPAGIRRASGRIAAGRTRRNRECEVADSSFDVVSKVERQEVDNALHQAGKELSTRFDFRNTGASIEWSGEETITLTADTEERLLAALDVFKEKLIRRDISLKAFDAGEPAQSGKIYKLSGSLVQGITTENAKKITKKIRDEGPKGVKAQIQGEELRVSSKKRDDLQAVISLLKGEDFGIALQFVNYR
ncbi:YajQ family cyclic di-GMP-binding protein [Rhodococcus sp. WS4]|nr:YajQ family cyclic di-GMP-binding protein [Rhodococcus sp. WS4]